MTTAILGPDPLEILIDAALRRLSEGEAPSAMEVERVDVKEEPGRRAADGSILSGAETNEQAADYLAGEMACMANTPGGGTVIVGVADGGQKIGTELNPEWLRHRIWELTAGSLTISARVANVEGSRLLVLSSVEALSPVAYRGRVRGPPDRTIIDLLGDLTPPQAATVEVLLLINHLTRHGWVDAQTAAPVLQRSPEEAEQAIAQLADTTLIARDSDQASPETPAIIVRVAGVPSAQSAAHRLSDAARQRLADRTKHLATPEGRLGLIIDWSRARGRVSSTEAADLTGLSRTSTSQLLASLADEGQLNLGRPNRTGRGFFYTPDDYTPDD